MTSSLVDSAQAPKLLRSKSLRERHRVASPFEANVFDVLQRGTSDSGKTVISMTSLCGKPETIETQAEGLMRVKTSTPKSLVPMTKKARRSREMDESSGKTLLTWSIADYLSKVQLQHGHEFQERSACLVIIISLYEDHLLHVLVEAIDGVHWARHCGLCNEVIASGRCWWESFAVGHVGRWKESTGRPVQHVPWMASTAFLDGASKYNNNRAQIYL